jgi:hypothetical protein
MGLNCGFMTCPRGSKRWRPQTLIMEKNNYGKNRSICPNPLISQENLIMEIMALQELLKKKVRITSRIF